MAIVIGAAAPAFAQQAAPAVVPPSAAPGRIEQQFQPVPVPKSTPIPENIPGEKPAEAPPGAADVRFTLTAVTVEGATVFTAGEFAPLYRDLLGKSVSLKQMYDLAAAITVKYGQAGYVLSQALVPAQSIAGGVVRIAVVQGAVGRVILQTDDGRPVHQRQLEAYGAKIAADRPLREAVLERYLLLANDLPGVTARAVLSPSQTPGSSDLTLIVSQKAVDGAVGIDNRGTRYLGPYQASLSVNVNDLFGRSDRTGLRVINTLPFEDLHYVELNHHELLGADGATLDLVVLSSWSHLDANLRQFDIRSTDVTGSAQLRYPLIRSRARNLYAAMRLDIEELQGTSRGDVLSRDRLRILRPRLDYDFVDTALKLPAVNLLSLEVSQGLSVFGATGAASPFPSRAGMASSFTKLTFDLSRTQSLPGRFALVAAGHGQYAFETLPASEEFGYGGAGFGRGYDPSEIVGDHGIAGRVELQYSHAIAAGKGIGTWLRAGQLYAFTDTAHTWNRHQRLDEQPAQGATSAGAGLRFNLIASLTGYLEVAVPITTVESPQRSKGPRAFFSLAKAF